MGRTLAAWLMVATAMAAPPTTPREVVESAVTRVVTALRDADAASAASGRASARRRAEITRVAGELFDFEKMAHLTLPRQWATRTRAEQAEFVRLFTQVLERTYIDKLESYAGEKIVYLAGTVDDGGYATVRSKVVSGRRRAETSVDYRLYVKDGRWRVYDVLIDGLSIVSTYRTEFDRVIQVSSYGALVDTLRRRAAHPVEVGATRGGSVSPRTGR